VDQADPAQRALSVANYVVELGPLTTISPSVPGGTGCPASSTISTVVPPIGTPTDSAPDCCSMGAVAPGGVPMQAEVVSVMP
jgi:hypothetical protein